VWKLCNDGFTNMDLVLFLFQYNMEWNREKEGVCCVTKVQHSNAGKPIFNASRWNSMTFYVECGVTRVYVYTRIVFFSFFIIFVLIAVNHDF
jgi:hypothetical protein